MELMLENLQNTKYYWIKGLKPKTPNSNDIFKLERHLSWLSILAALTEDSSSGPSIYTLVCNYPQLQLLWFLWFF